MIAIMLVALIIMLCNIPMMLSQLVTVKVISSLAHPEHPAAMFTHATGNNYNYTPACLRLQHRHTTKYVSISDEAHNEIICYHSPSPSLPLPPSSSLRGYRANSRSCQLALMLNNLVLVFFTRVSGRN